ncbi:MAG: hydroxymethylbilane synthase [Saprospiraceae bacterium]|nr:hydroxymethylbilane synthase [Saprospiraceae bacterium]
MDKLIIGTRGSKLALWQANYTQERLKSIGIGSELKIIKTKGDQVQHLSFDKIEGKGFFTKEIEDALLNNEVDLAVHSMKDMPTTQPEGLCLAAISYREDAADCLVIRKDIVEGKGVLKLPKNPIVGTSSARRKALIKEVRPDAVLKDIRGNVPTRLEKLREGQFDAIILAMAGIKRLGLDMSDFEAIRLNPKEFVPAPAQGVLAWQAKKSNEGICKLLRKIHDKEVLRCTNIERTVLKMLDGGCHLPLGVYCEMDNLGYYHVYSILSGGLDKELHRVNVSSSISINLAKQVYDRLVENVNL